MYSIAYSKQAAKTLRKLPRNWAQRIRENLEEVAQAPYGQHQNVTKLQGRSGYRLRAGDWRIIYLVQDEQLIVAVLKIGPRGSIYQ